MLIPQKEMTVEEFIVFATSPENSDRDFEFINGEVIEMSPGRATYSRIEAIIAALVYIFCEAHGLPYNVSVGDGSYRIGNNTVAPDFAYRSADLIDEYPDPVQPEWAVEIISPNDKATEVSNKRQIYLRAGILYWEIYYPSQRVDVYAPGQPMKSYFVGDVLDGGEVLPGFTLEVSKLFV
ncbi:MAG: Uma2 family endonuclease [Chloroflexi bacterium]|nr:Uma2 family endonuclease [Chloroflexota bacterium]